jgi:excisionase family DNA binding protein
MVELPAFVTTDEAARRAGLNQRYITQLAKSGKLAGRKIGTSWIIYEDSLQAFIASERKPGPKGPIGSKRQQEPERQEVSAGHA